MTNPENKDKPLEAQQEENPVETVSVKMERPRPFTPRQEELRKRLLEQARAPGVLRDNPFASVLD